MSQDFKSPYVINDRVPLLFSQSTVILQMTESLILLIVSTVRGLFEMSILPKNT